MKNLSFIFLILFILWPGILLGQVNSTDEKCIQCEALTSLKLPDVRITEAVTISDGSLHCKILGVIGRK